MASALPVPVVLRYEVLPRHDAWELVEEPVPESYLHDQANELLRNLLLAWAAREARSALVARNLALRWVEARPKVGLDPDLAFYEPAPPNLDSLTSIRTWEAGHTPPKIAVEVVNPNHPHKDYVDAPARYAASGTGELWVFDPLLAGPETHGGPHRLQLWARGAGGMFERRYAGEGPVRSPFLGAWLITNDRGRRLRIADDAQGTRLWLTGEEAERAVKEAERAAKEAERAAKEEAMAKVARLEAELEALRRGGR